MYEKRKKINLFLSGSVFENRLGVYYYSGDETATSGSAMI